jgi:hypothetical protein
MPVDADGISRHAACMPQPPPDHKTRQRNSAPDVPDPSAIELLGHAVDAVVSTAEIVGEAAGSAAKSVGESAGSAAKAVVEAAGPAAEVVGEVAGSVVSAIGDVAP